jgi:hypothetical protein
MALAGREAAAGVYAASAETMGPYWGLLSPENELTNLFLDEFK